MHLDLSLSLSNGYGVISQDPGCAITAPVAVLIQKEWPCSAEDGSPRNRSLRMQADDREACLGTTPVAEAGQMSSIIPLH